MQPKEINILSIMKDLVSVQSDTGTRQEERAAEKIAEYFESDAYFAAHPDHWGLCDTGDFLGRRVVWALKEGKSRKVLVLTGHYDAVETDCYGELRLLRRHRRERRAKIMKSIRNQTVSYCLHYAHSVSKIAISFCFFPKRTSRMFELTYAAKFFILALKYSSK